MPSPPTLRAAPGPARSVRRLLRHLQAIAPAARAALSPPQSSPESAAMMFESIRRRVVEMSVLLADRGYFAATGGNLALRADEEHIVVTPSATDYQRMEAADVCVLRLADLVKV